MTPIDGGRTPGWTTEDEALLAHARTQTAPTVSIGDLDAIRLGALAQDAGIEAATALWYARLTNSAPHAGFMARVRCGKDGIRQRPDLIGVVPGAFHREHRDTGADGARLFAIARELGIPAELVPVASFGRLEENAAVIAAWLKTRAPRQIALISLSKGGADVKQALARPDATAAFAHVTTWISFSGVVQGTPLVRWLKDRPWRWWGVSLLLRWHGHRMEALRDLRHGRDTPLHTWPVLPPHLRIVHVCGCPLRRHLRHRWAARAYERLAPLGPNDGGGVLLGDLSGVPGIVCPIWGADHYLEPVWDATTLCCNIVAAALALGELPHANQSATAPTTPPASKSNA